ncbi:hypothetical protein AB9P05_03925 [Roseivirga sp. BDSF3-8]|uniref:hypothetical protein n=1 Tax=Roseivirga sp. BDSF3-8 TaxID=3241598 RepID=UPI003531C2B0
MRGLLILLFSVLNIGFVVAQSVDYKDAIDVVISVMEAENTTYPNLIQRLEPILANGEYAGETIIQHSAGFHGYESGFSPEADGNTLMAEKNKDNIQVVRKMNTNDHVYYVYVNNDKINFVRGRSYGYSVKYDEKGRVIKLTQSWHHYGKEYERYFFDFEYDTSERLKSVIKTRQEGQGKSIARVTPTVTYVKCERMYSYEEASISVSLKYYRDKNNDKDPDIMTSSSQLKYHVNDEDNQIDVYEEGELKKEYFLKNINQNEKQYVVNDIASGRVTNIHLYLDDRGWVKINSEQNTNKDGTKGETKQMHYTYNVSDDAESDDIANYTINILMRYFRATGEVYLEEKEGLYRRYANGEWSEWKYHRY